MKRINVRETSLHCIALMVLLPWLAVAQVPQVEQSSESVAVESTNSSEPAVSSAVNEAPMPSPVPGNFGMDRWRDRNGDDFVFRPPFPRNFGAGRWHGRNGDNAIVSIGSDATLAAGKQADNVVSIGGEASNAGQVADSVVSILGGTKVDGTVGDSAVAVLGDVYVNNKIGHDVVAVLGNVELGPQADVGGQVVAVLGQVTRDPAAIVRNSVQQVGPAMHVGDFNGLKSWLNNCFFYGRPLAFAPGLAWAWTFALGSLLLYVLTALLFPRGVERCVQTLETYPGRSILMAFLSIFLTPLLFLMLVITLIGIIAIPLVGIALFAMASFGKLVMLAWMGRIVTRMFKEGMLAHIAFAVLVGGLIVTGLYVVPILGFVMYKLLDFIGFGVVAYTLLLSLQSRRNHDHSFTGAATANAMGGNDYSQSHSAAPSFTATSVEAQTVDADASQSTGASAAHEAAALPLSYPRASFSVRMGALLIDAFLAIAAFSWLPGSFLLALAAYGALMWKLKGATIGGIICHLQVVRLDGGELNWATVIVRALSCFLSLFVVGLGFIWIAFDDDRQGWHDKLAGTAVVRLPKGVSLV